MWTHTQASPGGPRQSGICYRTAVLAVCGDVAAKKITFVYFEVLANKMQNLQVRATKRKT